MRWYDFAIPALVVVVVLSPEVVRGVQWGLRRWVNQIRTGK